MGFFGVLESLTHSRDAERPRPALIVGTEQRDVLRARYLSAAGISHQIVPVPLSRPPNVNNSLLNTRRLLPHILDHARLPSTRFAGIPACAASTTKTRRFRLQTRIQPRRPLDCSATFGQPGIDTAADAFCAK